MKTGVSWVLSLSLLYTAQAHAGLSRAEAEAAMKKAGCVTCHNIDEDKLGPAYKNVAAFYKSPSSETTASLKGMSPVDFLLKKIRVGTKADNRHWTKSKDGKKTFAVMTPTPAGRLSDADLKALLEFILSL